MTMLVGGDLARNLAAKSPLVVFNTWTSRAWWKGICRVCLTGVCRRWRLCTTRIKIRCHRCLAGLPCGHWQVVHDEACVHELGVFVWCECVMIEPNGPMPKKFLTRKFPLETRLFMSTGPVIQRCGYCTLPITQRSLSHEGVSSQFSMIPTVYPYL